MKILFFGSLFASLFLLIRCQPSVKDLMDMKNKCYNERLEIFKHDPLYNEIMFQFADTFSLLKSVPENFGVPERVTIKVDKSVFLTQDKSKCLLLVLQRNEMKYLFGSARVIDGVRNNGKWTFRVSLHFSFDRIYFSDYKENSFDNISKLARYSVLSTGNVKTRGCEIDEHFWFEELHR